MTPHMRIGARSSLQLVLFMAVAAGAEVVTLSPMKDNTLYQSDDGSLSNGAGEYIFAGRTNQEADISIRRGLLAFDLTGQVPAGSTIVNVTLTLHLSQTIAGPASMTLTRVLADWGESTSKASGGEGAGAPAEDGDATWIQRFHDPNSPSPWQEAGGDFAPTPSAVQTVETEEFNTWGPTEKMAADVQGWLDVPSSNFGWALIGSERRGQTAKRFDSRENSAPGQRPQLLIDFDLQGAPTRTTTPTPTVTETPTQTATPTPLVLGSPSRGSSAGIWMALLLAASWGFARRNPLGPRQRR